MAETNSVAAANQADQNPEPGANAAPAERLESPLDNEGLAEAGTEVPADGAVHAKPSVLGLDATGWVALSMIVVLAIVFWKKVPAMIGGILDKKIGEIKSQLDEAKQLREEADELRAKYEARLKAADGEAEEIREAAKREADIIVDNARTNSAALVERRQKMAEDKIAAAERAAVADVRAKAAKAATAAAAGLIAQKHDAAADQKLVDQTISGLGRVN